MVYERITQSPLILCYECRWLANIIGRYIQWCCSAYDEAVHVPYMYTNHKRKGLHAFPLDGLFFIFQLIQIKTNCFIAKCIGYCDHMAMVQNRCDYMIHVYMIYLLQYHWYLDCSLFLTSMWYTKCFCLIVNAIFWTNSNLIICGAPIKFRVEMIILKV